MNRSKKIIQVSIIGIAINILMAAFKLTVGLISNSIAVILDAVNNFSDALSSVVTIIGTLLSGKPANKRFPYGYGRIEHISSIVIAVMVILAGVTSFQESLKSVINPTLAEYSIVSLVIISVAVVVKYILGRYVKSEGVKQNSDALLASGKESIFDALISLSTLIAALISYVWHLSIEGYLGLVISLLIAKAGIEILLNSLSSIIGSRVESELSVKLKTHINTYEQVLGTYDLALHRYGPQTDIGSVHIEVDDALTAKEIHHLTRRIREEVYMTFGIILTIGIYASNTSDVRFHDLKKEIEGYVTKYPEVIQLHGFYVDEPNHRISFDLITDFKVGDGKTIKTQIIEECHRRYPDYHFDINLDQDYSD